MKITCDGDPATKTEAREILKRIRLNVRDIQEALRNNDWAAVEQLACDTMGAASSLVDVAEPNMDTES
jgi:hypothetical protein